MSMRRVPPGYRIEAGEASDIEALILADLAAGQLFAPTGLLSPAQLNDHVPRAVLRAAADAGDLICVRQESGAPVGFALISTRAKVCYLDQISVDPAHGRRGLGAALIDAVITTAKRRRLSRVTLSTFRDVAWNAPFYRRLGFREIARPRLAPWMLELEALQAAQLDVSKRCFMQRRIGWP